MSLEEAKERVKGLNKKNHIDREKAVAAARRSKFEQTVQEVFVDELMAKKFVKVLLDESFGGKENTKKLISHWQTVSKLIVELQLEAQEFGDRQNLIFKHFMRLKYSTDYVTKLVRIINLWGNFVCKFQGRHYEAVKNPKGHIREKIADAYLDKKKNRAGGAASLTSVLLINSQDKFKMPGQYEWTFVSFWFGLRPKEVDSLSNAQNWKVTTESDGTMVLHVYQSKLVTVRKDERWKLIPCLYPEQKKAIQFIKLGGLKRPLRKTLQSIFSENFGLYSGRKGFTDEMLEKGNPIEHVSAWLGHRTLDRTWRHYKNKLRVQYRKLG